MTYNIRRNPGVSAIYGLVFCATLLLGSACTEDGEEDKTTTTTTPSPAPEPVNHCVSVAVDPDQPVLGSFDVQRLTNTCDFEINLAFYSTDGRPTSSAPESPALSPGEWTRAFITQGSNGSVVYIACQVPNTVQDFPQDAGECVAP